MNEATFQPVRVSEKKFERVSIVLDNMWFENVHLNIVMCSTAAARPRRALAVSKTCADASKARQL
jgi:hypothetical protein